MKCASDGDASAVRGRDEVASVVEATVAGGDVSAACRDRHEHKTSKRHKGKKDC